MKKMKYVVPNISQFQAKDSARRSSAASTARRPGGGPSRTSIRWQKSSSRISRRRTITCRAWGASEVYMQMMFWADAVERAGTFYPLEVIKALEADKSAVDLGKVCYRAGDHQMVVRSRWWSGKKPGEMKGQDDFFDIRRYGAGRTGDAAARRDRLQLAGHQRLIGASARRIVMGGRRSCGARPLFAISADRPVSLSDALDRSAVSFAGLQRPRARQPAGADRAAGSRIILGTLGVLNFAHGAMFMLGAYAVSSCSTIRIHSCAALGRRALVLLVGRAWPRARPDPLLSTPGRRKTRSW